jgi:hypothetical protein
MEINDYVRDSLRVVSKRSRFIGAVVLAALVLSVAVYSLEPPRYRATATVVIPIPEGVTSLIAGVSQSVSDFEGALASESVAAGVAAATGVDRKEISSGLSSDRLVSGSVAEVAYEGRTGEEAQVVVREASRQALALLLEAALGPYEQQRQFAQNQLAAAEDDYEEFVAETGIFAPDRYFAKQTDRLNALRDALGVARGEGRDDVVETLERRISAKQAEISQQLADYNRLSGARQRALSLVTETESAYSTAKGSLDSTQTPEAISVSDAVRISRVAFLMRSVVPAVVIATGLAIAFVVLLELSRSGRSARGDDGEATAVPVSANGRTRSELALDERVDSTSGAATGAAEEPFDHAATLPEDGATEPSTRTPAETSGPSAGVTPQRTGPSR